jgi:hypothetical protein
MPKKYKVQKLVAFKGRTAAGQKIANVGQVWVTIATKGNKTVAERIQRNAQIDNPDANIRIEELSR